MLRIANIIQGHPCNKPYIYARLIELDRLGHQVTLFYRTAGDPGLLTKAGYEALNGSGVSCRCLRPQRNLKVWIRPECWRFISRVLGSGRGAIKAIKHWPTMSMIADVHPDIVHVEEYYHAINFEEPLNGLGVPIVVSLRGSDVYHKPGHYPHVASWYARAGSDEKWIRFHCVSESIRERALTLGVGAGRCRTILQGVALPAVKRGIRSSRRDLFIIIARLVPEKGVDLGIQAFARIAGDFEEVTLSVFGDGPQHGKLKELVASLGLSGRVSFHGEIPSGELFAHIHRNHERLIAIQPSRTEGLGQSILECQSAAIPVIATSAGGIPEIIQNGRTGILVDPEDIGALADGMRFLLNNPKQAEKIADFLGRNRPMSVREEAEQFEAWFREIVT